jgi:hypothetical protein
MKIKIIIIITDNDDYNDDDNDYKDDNKWYYLKIFILEHMTTFLSTDNSFFDFLS